MTNTIVQGAGSGASVFQLWQTWLTIGLLVVAVALFTRQAIRSWRLARRMLAGRKWPITRAWLCVFAAVLDNPAHAWSRRKLFDLVRKRLEFMIFYPRPDWYWPLRDDDDLYDGVAELNARVRNRDEGRAQVKKAQAAARERYKAAVSQWRQDLSDNRRRQVIVLELAGELNDGLSEVKLYFDTLRVLDPDPAAPIEFLTPVQINIGFIASQHLLTGLLVRFNEKWGGIIDGFERDTRDVTALIGNARNDDTKLRDAAIDFRQIQSFIYHCWLLWGPSVPVCEPDCAAWFGSYGTLQYGYGDENNSIEIVGSRATLTAQVRELMGTEAEPGPGAKRRSTRFGDVMAVPASVRGVLQYSSIAQLGSDRVPDALFKSWGGGQDERPILRLSTVEVHDEDARAENDRRDFGKIKAEIVPQDVDPNRSRYYSAYFWVMFVIERQRSGEWAPVHPSGEVEGRSAALWKAAIPFFEHGNMADAASCAFAKVQLADKALNGLVHLVTAWERDAGVADSFPLRFAYVSGIDDPNCSKKLALEELEGGTPVVDLMRARIDAEMNIPGSAIAALVDRGIIVRKSFDPVTGGNHHATCALPGDVAAHYARLDAHEEQAEREAARA